MAKRLFKSDEFREFMRSNGAKGGKARAGKLTKKRLSEIGRAAVRARWAAEKAKRKADQ